MYSKLNVYIFQYGNMYIPRMRNSNALNYICKAIASNLCRDTANLVVFHDFPQPLQENAKVIPRLHHDCFLQNFFKFIIHEPTQYSTHILLILLYRPL
jgi:hypothetical protein